MTLCPKFNLCKIFEIGFNKSVPEIIILFFVFSLFLNTTSNCQITFSRVFNGDIVNDAGVSAGYCWGDYDNDGFVDLFVANWQNHNNFLYHNNTDGSFTKIKEGSIVNNNGYTSGACWGDYDNDGFLDLFVVNQRNQNNELFHNNGDGTFEQIGDGDIVNDYGDSYSCAWVDYNNDGLLDLFVANSNQYHFLYENNGDGSFTKHNDTEIVNDIGNYWNCSWGDFNNDGFPDLFLANTSAQNNALYVNNGGTSFTKILKGPLVNDGGYSKGGSWGDFDNDGDLDLFVATAGFTLDGMADRLYKNNGDGTFTKIIDGPIVNNNGYSHGGDWGDYDNDGDLDLLVGRWGLPGFLYSNNGNGTFVKVTEGAIVSQSGFVSNNIVGSDYDNDGDLDIFLANWENQNNILFRNDSHVNNWIKIKLKGETSNKFGIGAKIFVVVQIQNKLQNQMREIQTNIGCRTQGGLTASFGISDAEIIENIKVVWPSGKIDEISNVEINQIITITEGKGVTAEWRRSVVEVKSPVYTRIYETLSAKGIDEAVKEYHYLKEVHSDDYDFSEPQLNYLGYQLMQEGKLSEAIKILELNVNAFPNSANVYDSIAEAYLVNGNNKLAIEFTQKLLEIIEDNSSMDDETREFLINTAKYRLKNIN